MSRLVTTAPRPRVRAGGRSAEVRVRVATACLELLAEGAVDFGPVEVARRSGVSRATLHRWWPTKSDLLAEALAHHTRSLTVIDTGSWEGDLRALVGQLAGFFSEPLEVAQNVLMASGAYPDYTQAVLEHYQAWFRDWRAVVSRGQSRGEVAADLDPDAVLQAALSPLVLTPLLYRRRLTKHELADLITVTLRGTRPVVE